MNFLVFALFLLSVNALFKDEVGLRDWSLQLYGVPSHAFSVKNHVIVGSSSGVVASINKSSGQMKWRIVDPIGASVDALEVASSKTILSISGGVLRCISTSSGVIHWDASSNSNKIAISKQSGKSDLVAYTSNYNTVTVRHIDDGSEQWVWEVDYSSSISDLFVSGDKIFAVIISVSNQVTIKEVTEDGYEEDSVEVLLCRSDSCGNPILSVDSENGEKIVTTLYKNEVGKFKLVFYSSKKVIEVDVDNLLKGGDTLSEGLVLSSSVSQAQVVLFLKNNQIQVRSSKSSLSVLSSPLGHIIASSDGKEGLNIYDVENKKQSYLSNSIHSDAAIASVFECTENNYLIVGVDGTVSFVALDKMKDIICLWSSDQSLTSISQALFVLPFEAQLEDGRSHSQHDPVGEWINRFQSQASYILSFPSIFLSIIYDNSATDHEKSKLFGFYQSIIVVTSSGRMVALSTENGSIKWSIWLKESFKIYSIGNSEIILVGSTSYQILDASSGKVLNGPNSFGFSSPPRAVIPIPWENKFSKIKPIFIVGGNSTQYKILPQDALGINDYGRNIRWVDISQSLDIIRGYYLNVRGDIVELWSIVLSENYDGKIFEYASRSASEVVSSQAKKLGDDGLLLKYLNPHLVTIVKGVKIDGSLDVFLIDSVAGTILYQTNIADGTSPLHVLMFENWVIINFWNSRTKRSEMLVITMHSGSLGKYELNPISPIPPSVLNMAVDGGAISKPHIFSQVFVSPDDIRAIGVTNTKAGISSKQVLLGLGSESLLSLDLRLIDPRRPLNKPTAEEQLEGLIQYSPRIPLIRTSILSYNMSLPFIKGIISSPAELESTSLVFVYGLDLFYTRHMPSNGFDLLPDSFNKPLLVLLTAGLSVALFAARAASSKKSLSIVWA